jgi:hypothetical protein
MLEFHECICTFFQSFYVFFEIYYVVYAKGQFIVNKSPPFAFVPSSMARKGGLQPIELDFETTLY